MADVQGIYFQPNPGVLICRVHGTGVHPEQEAIKRHLRGEGHHCKGRLLKESVSALVQLPLLSRLALLDSHPSTSSQPVNAVPHLAVRRGWSCLQCSGAGLTTSEEVRDRHVAKAHREKPSSHCDERPLWEDCELQTLFIKTGDRRYFRVTPAPILTSASDLSGASQPRKETDGDRQAQEFLARVIGQREANSAINAGAANVNPDTTAKGATDELWMKKLGVSRYIAGLRKDEMAESYKACKINESIELKDLCEITSKMLHKTWGKCQHGPQQRMTDPQAARISSF